MSLEAWGDEGDCFELPDGCWDEDTVEAVQSCIRDLMREPVYENGRKEDGISVRFIARLHLLAAEAEVMDRKDPVVLEAERVLSPPQAAR